MLPPAPTLLVFLLSAVVLLVVPGPAVLYIVARSVDQGRRAGLVSTLGIATGTLFHVAAAAAGVSAILVSSAAAFQVVKLLGAAYLVWLGVRKLLGAVRVADPGAPERLPTARLFREGVVVNVLNPKTALFFFAFLPQFVDPGRGQPALQIAILGTLFVLLGVASDGAWALLAGTAGNWLRGNARFARWRERIAGGTFVALGLAAAFGGHGKK